jgi:ferrochelatase
MTSSLDTPVGVLLVNLGTPDGPDVPAVRRYLAQFLSDPRVVELSRVAWLPILYGVILNTRPRRSAAAYEEIWNREDNESPLKTFTRRLAEKLGTSAAAGAFGSGPAVPVEYAMRYQNPSIEEKLEALMAKGCERILILPLYPQYAASTTATVFDEVARLLRKKRRQPTLRFAAPYYDDPAYIDALASSLRAGMAALDFEPEAVVASFHGLPQLQVDRGDPYKSQCEATFRLLREAMGLDEDRLRLSFQSRFGPAQWVQPYTSDVVTALGMSGVKRLAIVAPGFSADCLETIEELGVEIRDLFMAAGGEKFARIPCLNDSEEGVKATLAVARRELAGWA